MKSEFNLPDVFSFEWDEGNIAKSSKKHKVELLESEQIFHNNPVYLYDEKHSQKEDRYAVYGITDKGRKLFIVFTIRNDKIRIISSRDQNRRERSVYEKNKTNTKI